MNNFKTIVKFTLKETFFKRSFLISNIIMMFVVIFLSNMIIKINNTTSNYIKNNPSVINVEENINQTYNEESISANNLIAKESIDTLNNTFNFGFIVAFILFFTIYFYGYMVSNSVANEKTSRVLETLLVSTSPETIIYGKTVAMGILSVGQMLFLGLVAIISIGKNMNIEISKYFNSFINAASKFNFKSFFKAEYDLEFSNIIIFLLIFYVLFSLVLFFVFGYLFYAFICAIAGASISRAEDIQIVNGPISIIAMLAFYASVFTTSMPNTSWAPIVKYLPFSSAFSMPVNILNGTTNLNEITISLIILILATIWLSFVTIKIYKQVVFNYGNRVRFKDLLEIIFLKNEKSNKVKK